MVNLLAFYSEDLSSNHADVFNFYCVNGLKRTKRMAHYENITTEKLITSGTTSDAEMKTDKSAAVLYYLQLAWVTRRCPG